MPGFTAPKKPSRTNLENKKIELKKKRDKYEEKFKRVRKSIYDYDEALRIGEYGKMALNFAKQAIKKGKIPIIVLPDTSMRTSTYFFNTLLVNAFPEIYLPLYKKYRQQAITHVYSSRENNIVKIPQYLKQIPNAEFIIFDHIHSGNSVNKIKLSFEKELNKSLDSKNINEFIFNGEDKPIFYKNTVPFEGFGNVVKDKQGNIEIIKKRKGKFNLDPLINEDYDNEIFLEMILRRRELRQMALYMAREYKLKKN